MTNQKRNPFDLFHDLNIAVEALHEIKNEKLPRGKSEFDTGYNAAIGAMQRIAQRALDKIAHYHELVKR